VLPSLQQLLPPKLKFPTCPEHHRTPVSLSDAALAQKQSIQRLAEEEGVENNFNSTFRTSDF
jgi:hypothetical protein